MTFSPQTFAVEEILTSTKMSQMDANIDAVRNSHKGNSAPPSPTAGTLWLDDSSEPWNWQMYDGATWISLGKIDPTTDHFSGLGPALIVSAVSLSGSSYNLQQSAINGLSAWKLVLKAASPSTGAQLRMRFFDNESVITASNYNFGWIDVSNTTVSGEESQSQSAWDLTPTGAGGSVTWDGEIDVWIDADGYVQIRWDLHGSQFTQGHGSYEAAVTDLDGFQLFLSSGNFDAGTVAVYRMPEYQHT